MALGVVIGQASGGVGAECKVATGRARSATYAWGMRRWIGVAALAALAGCGGRTQGLGVDVVAAPIDRCDITTVGRDALDAEGSFQDPDLGAVSFAYTVDPVRSSAWAALGGTGWTTTETAQCFLDMVAAEAQCPLSFSLFARHAGWSWTLSIEASKPAIVFTTTSPSGVTARTIPCAAR